MRGKILSAIPSSTTQGLKFSQSFKRRAPLLIYIGKLDVYRSLRAPFLYTIRKSLLSRWHALLIGQDVVLAGVARENWREMSVF